MIGIQNDDMFETKPAGVQMYMYFKQADSNFADFLLCSHCGHEVARAADLLTVPSTKALRQRNDTILGVRGVLIQLFENPQGKNE